MHESQETRTEELTALALIDRHSAREPARRAVIFEDQILTYGELTAASRRMARALITRGVQPGDRVCLLAHNKPSYYVAYLATLRCGAAFFPINADLAVDEIAYIARRTEPILIIEDEGLRDRMNAACTEGQIGVPRVGLSKLENEARAQLDDETRDTFPQRLLHDVALVVHTSGTTALPKGVVATDHMEAVSALSLHSCWDIKPGDISVCALPLSYTFGLFSASYVALTAGATVLLFPKFNPVRVLEGIERHRATYMVGVPTMYAMMLEHVEQTGKCYDLASMRMMAASGAPTTPKAKEDFHRKLGVVLRDYYALSECTPIFSFDLRTDKQLPPIGSAGKLVPGAEVELLDDHGRRVARGETGALRVRSERLMQGYYLDPDRTAASFDGDWFRTGDLAYQDENGYYFIVGRDRDQVISGGHKIASTEVESVITRMPEVSQVAVVGSPHEVLGEVVKAVVVLKDGKQIAAESVIAFCERNLAAFKVPRLVEFRDALPISPAGKVLKRELM